VNALLPIHIAAGGIALLAGYAALALRKGSPSHARAGTWFFGAMLVMAGTGALVAAARPERGTMMIGIFTCYLVATSWVAARRRDGKAGRFELLAFPVALACAAALLAFGLIGAASPNGRMDSLPAMVHFPFAAVAALAAALDLNVLLRGELSGLQRTARHVWRMCAAFLIAAFSFFLGQQKVMPALIQGSPLLFVPPLLVLAAMIFWLLRVRFSKAFRWVAPRMPETRAAALPAREAVASSP
jgi:hypothetical protein